MQMNQNNESMSKYLLRKLDEYNKIKYLLFVELCIKYETSERLNDYYKILELDKRN